MVALLRGVNVGGRRRVPMADLRAVCEGLGFRRVVTYVQSGNAVFEAAGTARAAEERLARAVEERFGFPVDLVVRAASAWEALVAANPFPGPSKVEPGRVLLLVSKAPPRKGCAKEIAARGAAGERAAEAGGALWVHYPAGVGTSKITPALVDRLVGSPTTARNWRTVLALQGMLREE
jgi:uncharacterized protein (DUF1697 family)